mmetsp:Transcript_35728/g.31513  ORF Transcript_35728/g.31513 Transcript_35728/m.31513 type:complete len:276 (+) Transcript_35728:97-924(+)
MGSACSSKLNKTVVLSDETIVRQQDFQIFDNIKHSFDPLGVRFEAICKSDIICKLQIPIDIVSIILECLKYDEKSGIHAPVYQDTITSSPTKNFSECCLLMTTPNPPKTSISEDVSISYCISSIYYKCGYFDIVTKDQWPDNAKIYFQIEEFDGKNHLDDLCVNQSKYNVKWKSKVIECGGKTGKQVIKIKNIDLKLKNNTTYLLWVEVLKEPFHALYTYYDPYFKKYKDRLIHKEKKFNFCREVKLCDNKWFLRNVNKIWEVKFYAKINKKFVD